MKKQYLTSKEACEYLGIKNLDTLYIYIKEGKLTGHKLGGKNSKRHWRFLKEDLDKFVLGESDANSNSKTESKQANHNN